MISSACCSIYFRNRHRIVRSRFCSLCFVITVSECLNFVSRFCTVEIEFPGFLIKAVIDRDRIGVTLCAVYSQNPTAAFNQQLLCRFCAELIFFFRIGLNIAIFFCLCNLQCVFDKLRDIPLHMVGRNSHIFSDPRRHHTGAAAHNVFG